MDMLSNWIQGLNSFLGKVRLMTHFHLKSAWGFLLLVLLLCFSYGGPIQAQSSASESTRAQSLSRFKLLGPFQFFEAKGNGHGGGAGHYSNRNFSAQEVEQAVRSEFASAVFYQDSTGHLQVVDSDGRKLPVSVSAPDASGNQLISYSYNDLTTTIEFMGTITTDRRMSNAYYQYSYSYGTFINGQSISAFRTFEARFESPLTAV